MLTPCLVYEDDKIFVKLSTSEFVEMVEKSLKMGKTLTEAIDEVVKELKRLSLTT